MLLQELVVREGKRFGKIARLGRKVLVTNEIWKKGVATSGQVVQQSPKTNEMENAGLVAQGRLLFAQPTEPTKQMRIAVQLRELADLRESSAEIAEEAASDGLILFHRAGPGRQGEGLDVPCKDLFEAGLALVHEM